MYVCVRARICGRVCVRVRICGRVCVCMCVSVRACVRVRLCICGWRVQLGSEVDQPTEFQAPSDSAVAAAPQTQDGWVAERARGQRWAPDVGTLSAPRCPRVVGPLAVLCSAPRGRAGGGGASGSWGAAGSLPTVSSVGGFLVLSPPQDPCILTWRIHRE